MSTKSKTAAAEKPAEKAIATEPQTPKTTRPKARKKAQPAKSTEVQVSFSSHRVWPD